MKFKRCLIILSILLAVVLFMGSVMASNVDDNITVDSSGSEDIILTSAGLGDDSEVLSSNHENSTLSSPKTIVVENVEDNHNEMSSPTIQTAIDEANAGDTIIINGKSYVHCHFVVDKQLTIISNVATTMEVCPSSTKGSDYHGIFYISPEASGTVIDGFTIKNSVYNGDDYGILVRGASDVVIKNCVISNGGYADAIRFENSRNAVVQNVSISNANNGIRIKNSENVVVNESLIENNKYGINVADSVKMTINDNNIVSNKISGVAVSGKSSYITFILNNFTSNKIGVNLTATDNINILSNYFGVNTNYGVYVNANITKIVINGNFFYKNGLYEIFNDHRVKNLFFEGGEKLQVINNNYMVGHQERPIWRQVYEYKPGLGDFDYDAENDEYIYVGYLNGDYDGHQSGIFLGYIFEINEFVSCPNIYYIYDKNPWIKIGNFELQLSEITQTAKGVYSISIVDENGNIASDLGVVPVTFYVNKQSNRANPQEGDIYKTVVMKNGTATVRFYADDFKETGNVITAVVPSDYSVLSSKISKTFEVSDENIPGIISNTTLTVSNLNTYPNSGAYVTARLVDENGNPLSDKILNYKINSKTSTVTTDINGEAKIKISQSKVGTYALDVSFDGDDIDYYGSSASSKVVVKFITTKIVSSNLNMIPKMAEYYSITLKDASGNPLAGKKVTFKVNGKTYKKTTNSKGVAKVLLKFSKNKKTYKISIKFAGDKAYKAASKTNKILVKYSSKTSKLSAPKVSIPPKTAKKYTVTLKDANGKGISKQKVIIKVNGKTYTKKTNSQGKASIKVKFSKLKNYKVSATYKGSKIYQKASASGKIKVAKTATKITAPNVSILPNVISKYTITLKTGAGKVLSKQKVTIKVNEKTYTKTTNSKGQTSINVKFASEKSYSVAANYKGTGIYKASKATGKIVVSKITTNLESYDRTYSKNSSDDFIVTLKDSSGNSLSGQLITFNVLGNVYNKTTDENGQVKINVASLGENTFDIVTNFAENSKYKSVSNTNKITITDKLNTTFIDTNLSNVAIQQIIDDSEYVNIEFLDDTSGVALTINRASNIYSAKKSLLNGMNGSPVFTINADNVNVTNLTIKSNGNSAVLINASDNICLKDNYILQNLNESLIDSYVDGSLLMPNYGIHILNSNNVFVLNNYISVFESGVFAEYSSNLYIEDNVLRENNYGVNYGYGVSDTLINHNTITESTGLYTMLVPEGPSGYGIFLNNSAVNVTITKNNITYNHIGISLDANYSTGIVITGNLISDNILEGIRFNAGYDLANNAVEPIVTDNAIYRNARGPSMMILGELSANPGGIYAAGAVNDSEKLCLDANWYGTNSILTWDNDTGIVGYGTMCPRIKTYEIKLSECNYISPGTYSVSFTKDGKLDTNLPRFDIYAILNRETNNACEINFDVINGVGQFSFNVSDFKSDSNIIEFSVISINDDSNRLYKVFYTYNVSNSEISA